MKLKFRIKSFDEVYPTKKRAWFDGWLTGVVLYYTVQVYLEARRELKQLDAEYASKEDETADPFHRPLPYN